MTALAALAALGVVGGGMLPPRALAQTADEPAPVGPSADLAEEADLHFRLGIGHYRAGRYEDALQHLLQSNRLVPNRNVVFNIARAYEQIERFDEAYRHYFEYVAFETDPERRDNGLRAIDRIRDEIALVRVTSDPPGATLYVDRIDLGARGRTPVSLALTPGTHRILLELAGHDGAQADVVLAIGQEAALDLPLERILGTLRVDGSPPGAAIRLGDESGAVLATLPGTLELPPGPHVLVVSADGYRTTRQIAQVTARAEGQTVVDLALVTGSVVVNAHERDALVEIDGRAEGFTPAVLDVAVGIHELRVSLRGYHPFVEQIEVLPEQSTTIDVQLRSLREVVAASRTAQSIEDAPASVTLLTSQEIRAFGYQDLYQALGGVRGVFQSYDLTYQFVGFRGFSTPGDYGNRVLVTVDGHTLNDDQLGASYVGPDFATDLLDVQQIEVVRGPGSALYGSNAFFGVINVVTHDHETMLGPHASVAVDVENTLRARVGGSLGDEGRGLLLSAAGATSQGLDYQFDELVDIPRGNPTGQSEDAGGYLARMMHAKGWIGSLTAQAWHTGRQKSIPTGAFDTILADPRAVTEDFRTFGELRYEPELGENAQLYSRVYLDAYSYRGRFPYGPKYVFADFWNGQWFGVEPRLVARPTTFLVLTVGAETRQHYAAELFSWAFRNLEGARGSLQDPPRGTTWGNTRILDETPTFQVYSAYGIAELLGGDTARLSAGGRVDLYQTPDAVGENFTTFNPRVALIVKPRPADIVKLMGGSAFRAPSPYEYLYNDDGQTQIRPEGSLEPERILTAEGEYTHLFDDVTSVVGSVYHNRIARLVSTEPVPGQGVFAYANTEDTVLSVGVEAEVRRDWRQGWMTAVQYSGQRTRVADLLGDAEIVNSPAHLTSLKGAAPLVAGLSTVSTIIRVESPRLLRDGDATSWAFLVDATLTGELPTVRTSYMVGVRNALDWRYAHPGGDDLRMPSLPQPGRGFTASLTTEF